MKLDQTLTTLPDLFYAPATPTAVASPSWVMFNKDFAEACQLDKAWQSPEGLAILSGQRTLASPPPIALAYSGHQFGHWVPLLGDGRALLLGQHKDPQGEWWDIQLKGAGPTPFSRNGDGRSSIGPVVREYLASEAMAALGIPTTRALAAISTGESVQRTTAEPGGILVRMARSHIRIGTFEWVARQGHTEATQALLDYLIAHHHLPIDEDNQALAFYHWVIHQTAHLIAQWMSVGFIHGVMNTDNCSILADTIDYGPFGFLDAFIPDQVYSSIDQGGRYAYQQQPAIATWNLARLAECLLPLIHEDLDQARTQAQDALADFPKLFQSTFQKRMTDKVGLDPNQPRHVETAMAYLDVMAANDADMTLAFRRLGLVQGARDLNDEQLRVLFDDPQAVDQWLAQWRQCLDTLGEEDAHRKARMDSVNPAFILRNHLAQEAVDRAIDALDFSVMHKLNGLLSRPFDEQPEHQQWAGPPHPSQRVLTTFCGT